MPPRWFTRDRAASDPSADDEIDQRIARQARRAGRSPEDEQERILREVLPAVRRTVAEAGLTIEAYLRLDEREYQELLAAKPATRSLLGGRTGLLDYPTYARFRRWIEAAAERSGEDIAVWVARTTDAAPRRPWERLGAATPPPVTASTDRRPTDARPTPADDVLLERLERLTALRDAGALTDDEFQTQKRRLLDADA